MKKLFCSNKLYEKQRCFIDRFLLRKIIVLLKLCLMILAKNAVSERSVIPICCIKNWLRSTMSQERLELLLAAFNT